MFLFGSKRLFKYGTVPNPLNFIRQYPQRAQKDFMVRLKVDFRRDILIQLDLKKDGSLPSSFPAAKLEIM